MGFQLYQLGVLLILLQQSDHSKNDLRLLDEIELETDCPYSTLPRETESLSEVVCDTDGCPVQKLLRRLLKQGRQSRYLLCPLSPLNVKLKSDKP
jgi:hypothetical protein